MFRLSDLFIEHWGIDKRDRYIGYSSRSWTLGIVLRNQKKMTNHLLRMKLVTDNSTYDRNTRNKYLYFTAVYYGFTNYLKYRKSFPDDVSLSQVNFWIRIYFQILTILDEDAALPNILRGISIDDLREGQGYVINNTATMRVRDAKLFGYEELIANTYTKSIMCVESIHHSYCYSNYN